MVCKDLVRSLGFGNITGRVMVRPPGDTNSIKSNLQARFCASESSPQDEAQDAPRNPLLSDTRGMGRVNTVAAIEVGARRQLEVCLTGEQFGGRRLRTGIAKYSM